MVDRKLSPVLNEVMIKTSKDEHLYKVFAGAFHEVVEPHLNELSNDMRKVERALGKVEDRLDKMDDRLDRHGATLDNHEKRISSLEESPLVH